MDPNEGRFEEERESNRHLKRFAVGETVKVKDEEFQVMAIQERRLILKPLSAFDRGIRDIRDATPNELEPEYDGPPRNRAERRREEALARRAR